MFNSVFMVIGVVVIIFIISVSLVLFAPRSINFYGHDTFPILKYINENNNQIIKDEFYKIKNNDDWLCFPDKKNISGTCEIWPIYMFNIKLDKRINQIEPLYQLIQNIPDIKTCTFMKLESKSCINKNKQWQALTDTLRCIYILDSPDDTAEKCAVWVNGEAKKIKSFDLIIYDSSKEYSIYNNTKHPLHMLMLDIIRPDKISKGISDREYDDEVNDFIYKLSKE